MKSCPECRKDYFDESLVFCLDDGSRLVNGSGTEEHATAILSGDVRSGELPTRALNSVHSFSTEPSSGTRRLPNPRSALPWILSGIFALIAAGAAGYAFVNRQSRAEDILRLAFEPPAGLSFNDVQPDWAVISPDGQKMVFSAIAEGKSMLYVKQLDSPEAKLLPGSENPLEPFWSPDSRAVAYGSNGKLKRSDLSGGNAQTLCDAARMVGGSWSKDGTIIFVPDYRTTIVQVSANGGDPKPVTMNRAEGEIGRHRYPYFLPDGRRFLFLNEQKGLWAGSLDSPNITQIVPDNTPGIFAEGGWLIFVRNDALVVQAFDESRLALSGEARTIISDQKSWVNNFRFSVSETGVLVWQGVWEREYQLTWFDREGKQIGAVESPAKISVGQDPQISPDGKRVVIKRNPPNTIWVVDLEKSNSVRITSDFGQMPLWSPDGLRLAYSGVGGLVTKASNGLGDPEIVLSSSSTGATFPCCWSPDGRFIVYQKRGVRSRLDIYTVELNGEKKEISLVDSPFDESSPAFSPDGKWLAYAGDDTGSYEVYVQPFTVDRKNVDRKRISTTGGRLPVWGRDGTELFFIAGDGQMMTSSVKANGDAFEFTAPRAMFKTRMLSNFGSFREFDVSPDGQRFLIGTLIGESTAPAPTVILNWPALVRK